MRIKTAVAALACLLALGMARKPRDKEGKMQAHSTSTSSWSGAFCAIAAPQARLVRNADEWRRLWKEAFGNEAPAVNFSRHFAAVVFLGVRNTGGYSVEFLPLEDAPSGPILRYRVQEPEGFVIQALTQPYAIRLYPKTPSPVKLEESPK